MGETAFLPLALLSYTLEHPERFTGGGSAPPQAQLPSWVSLGRSLRAQAPPDLQQSCARAPEGRAGSTEALSSGPAS